MNFLLRRLVHGGIVLLAMSLLVFAAVYAIGSPVDLLVDPNADATDRERVIRGLGLDRPLPLQYLLFLKGALSGNLGNSFIYGTPAIPLILSRLPATLELALSALAIAVLVGLPLGLYAGAKRNSASRLIEGFALLGLSLPTFWIGLMLILVFAVDLQWLPPGGRGPTHEVFGIELSCLSREGWRHLLLPATTLALFNIALLIRVTRSGVADALGRDYVRFARSRGLGPARILGVHVLRNLMIPIITLLGLEFGSTVAFAVVTESVFGWPGMGKLLIDAVGTLDRPLIVAYLLLTTTLFVAVNLLIDVSYGLLDPRLRRESGDA